MDIEKKPSTPTAGPTEARHSEEGIEKLGYTQELKRNRSLLTLLFQTLAIVAIPYGEGAPLISAIYGGGPLSIFVGWIVVCVVAECVALSLAELASRYPTSAGPYYWSFQLAPQKAKTIVSFINGWIWLIGNWTITLSVNFGFASMMSGTISMYHPDWSANAWQLLLIFYGICLASLLICTFANRFLPMVDTICAGWLAVSILIIMIALSVKADAGRHSAAYALGHYDTSLSGWAGSPSSSAISLCVPVAGFAGLFFILPICFTLPPLQDDIQAPAGQVVPYIFHRVMGSPEGGLGLMFLVLVVCLFCSISISVASSRATWAFARDDAMPLAKVWARIDPRLGVPVWSLVLQTVVQMLLGLINLGSSSAFTAFASVGVVGLAVSYAIPIGASLVRRREEVNKAVFNCGPVLGAIINVVALAWISFELVLFCMPTALPVTATSMNYASVVFVGFLMISAVWYLKISQIWSWSHRVESSDTQRMRIRMQYLHRDLPARTPSDAHRRPRMPTDTHALGYLGHPGLPAQVCPGLSRPDRFVQGVICRCRPLGPGHQPRLSARFDFVSLCPAQG
ncbi:Amino acid permease [Rasamsonia emersonii CBS 393.64]|uniref:Amino acid permease n=1 Tax=Rasamsonia emersonii (strain ATCC 16479 / CBS 393.64 / IMI 116815) TaxID=1408163 RepID=A0A0F4Z040_RASE3|nr:Amino acid permease [Rasamsonia emersonii CBS 393.64]KKA23461.1 Amino acid permease [Rasamsonia emersonii CBS 393.64]